MHFPRSAAFRLPRFASSARSFRSSNSQPWQRFGQQSQRRGYASTAETLKPSGSDLPWLFGAIAVTIPGTYYVLNSAPSHGHDEHAEHDHGHGKGSEKVASEESKDDSEEESKDEEKSDSEEKSDEDSKDKDEESKDEGSEDKKDSSSSEGDDAKEDSKTGDSDSPVQGNVKKESDDAKGATKKRIESTQGKKIDVENSDEGTNQDGLSNTDTKHSTDPTQDNKSSKKSEGSPETAKTKGTVDPSRSGK